ncbi:Heparan sulfate 2-O-sulfotransferase pipe [Folsomia candida]|uniref:Heparan sulfate 2-O-sulfotransferase pipe n=1 Tax=Folsomia candida TaxID=158441 RepID=A0A226DVU5_FOLCA|nr:Heparan sulfate 2-O-sulfotransferase pipe [Folsomia candida]
MVNFTRAGGGCDQVVYINMDFSTCVLQNYDECRFEPENAWSQMMFFCGMDKRCNEKNGEWALNRAMENVDKYYSVVGVLEELDLSLEVFEAYIPRVFAGAKETYVKAEEKLGIINKNEGKPKISEEVKELVRNQMGNEIKFYEFCKQRLHRQAEFTRGLSH